jgi:thiamine kinase-like enzyme
MADDKGVARAREALTHIKLFWCLDERDIKVKRLGGLTNEVFYVDHAGEQYVLRLPGKGTEEYINRAHERVAAKEAARVKVAPDVVYADDATGIMVTRYADENVTMSPKLFQMRKGAAARAAEALKKLHASDAKFPARFELFAMIDEYLKVLSTKDVELPDGYHDALMQAKKVRKVLAAHPLPLVACHCDPLCENFLDTGKRMWIVDWEYAGMNDPMWDLGDFAVESEFSAALEDELLGAYFPAGPSASERGRFVMYKAMCDLLWTLWGLIQLANKNPVDDFRAYALKRFQRCKALMATEAFAASVDAVKRG